MDVGQPLPACLSYSKGVENKYLYNGKELQDDDLGGVNLDWSRSKSGIAKTRIINPKYNHIGTSKNVQATVIKSEK